MNAHAYDCRCTQCSSMAAAIAAVRPDGKAFFTDEEIHALSVASDLRCECTACSELRESEPFGEICTVGEFIEAAAKAGQHRVAPGVYDFGGLPVLVHAGAIFTGERFEIRNGHFECHRLLSLKDCMDVKFFQCYFRFGYE